MLFSVPIGTSWFSCLGTMNVDPLIDENHSSCLLRWRISVQPLDLKSLISSVVLIIHSRSINSDVFQWTRCKGSDYVTNFKENNPKKLQKCYSMCLELFVFCCCNSLVICQLTRIGGYCWKLFSQRSSNLHIFVRHQTNSAGPKKMFKTNIYSFVDLTRIHKHEALERRIDRLLRGDDVLSRPITR